MICYPMRITSTTDYRVGATWMLTLLLAVSYAVPVAAPRDDSPPHHPIRQTLSLSDYPKPGTCFAWMSEERMCRWMSCIMYGKLELRAKYGVSSSL